MTVAELAALAGSAGTVVAAFWGGMRKITEALGAAKKGDASLRDLVLEIRGKLDAMHARQQEHHERLMRLEHPWEGRTKPGLGSIPDVEPAE